MLKSKNADTTNIEPRLGTLPTIVNPLINTIFNCPDITTSKYSKIFEKIKSNDFILVVPSTHLLLFGSVSAENKNMPHPHFYLDIKFIESHILFSKPQDDQKRNPKIHQYFNLSDPKSPVTISDSSVHFKSRTCKIIHAEYLPNFNEYLKGSTHFLLLFIDNSLLYDIDCPFQLKLNTKTASASQPRPNLVLPLERTSDIIQSEIDSFELLLKLDPQIESGFHEILLQKYKEITNTSFKSVMLLKDFYFKIVKILIQWCYDQSFFNGYKGLDRMVYKYVETKFSAAILKNIDEILNVDAVHKYVIPTNFSYLSFCDIPSFQSKKGYATSIETNDLVSFELNLFAGSELLKKMSSAKTCDVKSEYLLESLTKLSQTTSKFKDADSLIGMLILCICRSNEPGIYSQFLYLQYFVTDPQKLEFGPKAYALSTFEVALNYLVSKENKDYLLNVSSKNKSFWSILKDGDELDVQKFLVQESSMKKEELFSLRSYDSKSVVSALIENKNSGGQILSYILSFESEINGIYVETLLQDRGLNNETLLMKAVKYRNNEIVSIFIKILLESCSEVELEKYLNTRENSTERTVTHYLGLNVELMRQLGHYMDWQLTDQHGLTPLFTLFRFYDHPDYDQLVKNGLQVCMFWYHRKRLVFDSRLHNDLKGNTLLHIVKSNANVLLDGIPKLVLNEKNQAGLTPLMIYSRYNRLNNIVSLLDRCGNSFLFEQVSSNQKFMGHNSFDFTKNDSCLKALGVYSIDEKDIGGKVKVLSLKYENKYWYLYMAIKRQAQDKNPIVVKHSLKSLQKWVHLFQKQEPESFIPVSIFSSNKLLELYVNQDLLFPKFRLNVMFERWSEVFTAICIYSMMFRKSLTVNNDFEMIKSISSKKDTLGNPLAGSFAFSIKTYKPSIPEEISSMKSVLKLSLSENIMFKKEFSIMKKLLIMKMIKSFDVEVTQLHLQSKYADLKSAHLPLEFLWNKHEYVSETNICSILFLLKCVNNLILKLQAIIQESIVNWWKKYGDYLQVQKQISLFYSDTNSPPDFEPLHETAIVYGDEENATSGSKDFWSSFFDRYFDGNKEIYKHKLLSNVQVALEKFKEADLQLRRDHLSITQEMCNFIRMKDLILYSNLIVSTAARAKSFSHR